MNEIEFLRSNHAFIIAEAGVNHNGDVDLAHRLIDAAADAGADAVKFQTFRAEGLATPEAPKAEYQYRTTGTEGNQLDMLRRLELSEECYPALMDHCRRRGILFMSTPHDWEAIEILDRCQVSAFKVGSGDLTNLPFLRRLAQKGRPIILSTGMGNLAEVEEAVEAIRSQGNHRLILLHCVTSYPAREEDCNLRAMLTLQQAFGVPVGFSDHTTGTETALAAVALGARIIEKHFTLDRSLPGPDHEASLEPEELGKLVRGIRLVEQALGDGLKRPKKAELVIMRAARKSIVAAKDIPAGTTITEDMLTTKRPGSGILPRYWNDIIGCRARVAIPGNSLLQWDQLGPACLSGQQEPG
jgi:N-acetylneuraminate synthase/N,N'-diacetyllegionaminate synthase